MKAITPEEINPLNAPYQALTGFSVNWRDDFKDEEAWEEECRDKVLYAWSALILNKIFGGGGSENSSRFIEAFVKIYNGGNGIKFGTEINNISYRGGDFNGFSQDIQNLSKNIFGAYLLAAISIGNRKFNISDFDIKSNVVIDEKSGHTVLSDDGTEANIFYNRNFTGPADFVDFTPHITLGHELFHGLDLLTRKHKEKNIVMNHNENSELLNSIYRTKSADLFKGNQERLYYETRAVAYEDLIRAAEPAGSPYRQFRNMYAPFNDTKKFTQWIVEWQVNFILNLSLNLNR